MRINVSSPEKRAEYFQRLDALIAASGRLEPVMYLDLGTRVIRVLNYSGEFTPHIKKQLAYVRRDSAPRFDATLVIWKESNFDTLAASIARLSPPANPALYARISKLATGGARANNNLQIFDQAYSSRHPLLQVDANNRSVNAFNPPSSTYYYAVGNLAPEEIIKKGHIFVRTFDKMLKGPSTALVHGAAIGLDGNGVLLCARGQRGKSTLAVRAMLDGFEYVSDDYLILGKEDSGLYAWPIYSIITLAPAMYGDLYDILDAKFVSNNARKDKYVFNIENYHQRFVSRYPVKMCMFPQIVSDPEPSVVSCSQAGKGRAITQLVHSTLVQMADKHDIATIKKLVDFLRDLPFYQINLCRDIEKNLQCLRNFLRDGQCARQENVPGLISSRAVLHPVFKSA